MAAAVTVENPLRQGRRLARSPEPCTIVIFGASGDLTRRKLMPALYNLALEQWLPAGFSVVGFARREDSDDVFRQHMHEAVDAFSRRRPAQPAVWERTDDAAGCCALPIRAWPTPPLYMHTIAHEHDRLCCRVVRDGPHIPAKAVSRETGGGLI